MLNDSKSKSRRFLASAAAILLVVTGINVAPVRAADSSSGPKKAAVAAMQAWLREIDQSQYAQSWKDASASFQKAATSDQWLAACNSVRTPLGKLKERKLASAEYLTEIPVSPGKTLKGDFVLAQFDASFENLAYAIETVCFEKAPDGMWKASGYYIKPKG